jgi:hypothetical protein
METNWESRVQRWMQAKMDAHFAAWLDSKSGKAWKLSGRGKSPYKYGFSVPEYIRDCIDAMAKHDESDAKGIMLANL